MVLEPANEPQQPRACGPLAGGSRVAGWPWSNGRCGNQPRRSDRLARLYRPRNRRLFRPGDLPFHNHCCHPLAIGESTLVESGTVRISTLDNSTLTLERARWPAGTLAHRLPRWSLDNPLGRTTAILLVGYFASCSVLALCGINSAFPWTFVSVLGLLALPQAVTLIAASEGLSRFPSLARYAAALVIGAASTLLVPHFAVWCVTALVVLWLVRRRGDLAFFRLFALSIVALTAGYALVWNANYLCARLVVHRLHDAELWAYELRWLGWLRGENLSPIGLYPLVRNPWLFALLERAYLMLFAEIFLVLIVTVRQGADRVAEYLRALFACYLLGLCVFLVYPTVGPTLHAPQAFSAAFAETSTGRLTRSMGSELRALATGELLNGFGYFVALPSLHVAAAWVIQTRLRRTPILFWICVPVNMLLISSTVLLGYHYLVDALAGAILAAGVLRLAQHTGTVDRASGTSNASNASTGC